MQLEGGFDGFLCLGPDAIMTQHQWKRKVDRGTISGCVIFLHWFFFFLSPSTAPTWSCLVNEAWRANRSLHKKLPADALSQPLNLGSRELGQAEESFVFRPWQEWKKIPTMWLCSIIQACLNGEGLMRNAAFERWSFKNSQSIFTVQFYTIIINRIQTTNPRLCYYFTQFWWPRMLLFFTGYVQRDLGLLL